MEPENGPLEKGIPIGNHHFHVPCENFWGVLFEGFCLGFYQLSPKPQTKNASLMEFLHHLTLRIPGWTPPMEGWFEPVWRRGVFWVLKIATFASTLMIINYHLPKSHPMRFSIFTYYIQFTIKTSTIQVQPYMDDIGFCYLALFISLKNSSDLPKTLTHLSHGNPPSSWESTGPTPPMPRFPQGIAGLINGLLTTMIP